MPLNKTTIFSEIGRLVKSILWLCFVEINPWPITYSVYSPRKHYLSFRAPPYAPCVKWTRKKQDNLYGEFRTQKEVKTVSVWLCFLLAKFSLEFNLYVGREVVTPNLNVIVALTLIPKLKDESVMIAALFWPNSLLL